jgi:serine/threonine protein kinase
MLQRIGRYEILDRIAAGGQGTVYRARDTVLDRVVAVKVINQPVADDPQYLDALQREARLAAGLDHPNITTVYDFQVEDGTALQKAGSDAVEALQQSLQATSEGVRLRAACAILDYSMKGAELLDLESRIAVLEGLPGEA